MEVARRSDTPRRADKPLSLGSPALGRLRAPEIDAPVALSHGPRYCWATWCRQRGSRCGRDRGLPAGSPGLWWYAEPPLCCSRLKRRPASAAEIVCVGFFRNSTDAL